MFWPRSSRWLRVLVPSVAVLAAGAGLLAATSCRQADPGGTATAPEPRDREGAWMAMHENFLERTAKGHVDVVFLGDSITQGWNNNATWKRHYSPRRAVNFGIGGDRTQHVLWRLNHGELDGLSPKVVVVMIGTNNLGSNTPDEIFLGVKAIVGRIKDKCPKAKVLLLGVFPRGKNRGAELEESSPDSRVALVNEKIRALDDGKVVKYLDVTKHFLNAQGNVPKTLMPDFLHLSDLGYRTWADAMEPTLWEMMGG